MRLGIPTFADSLSSFRPVASPCATYSAMKYRSPTTFPKLTHQTQSQSQNGAASQILSEMQCFPNTLMSIMAVVCSEVYYHRLQMCTYFWYNYKGKFTKIRYWANQNSICDLHLPKWWRRREKKRLRKYQHVMSHVYRKWSNKPVEIYIALLSHNT